MHQDILSLSEYSKHARNFAYKTGQKYAAFGAVYKKNRDEIIADLVVAMIKADEKWDGRGTKEGFRLAPCKWIVSKHIKKWQRHKKFTENKTEKSLKNIECRNEKEPHEYMCIKEDMEILNNHIKSGVLTDRQTQALNMYYYDGLTLSEIGKHLGVSKQRVQQLTSSAIKTLQEFCC